MNQFSGFSRKELQVIKRLNTPQKIQDFLDKLPINFEPDGDTCYSPRAVLKRQTAHCMEGALFAAACLWYHGHPPLLLDLVTTDDDDDHVVALFIERERWGAISKTNHGVLRYREPVYLSAEELAMSFFHEYFLDDGRKTLRQYSEPFDLRQLPNSTWLISEENLWDVNQALANCKHFEILSTAQIKRLRPASAIEIAAGKITEWQAPQNKKHR